MYGSSWIGEHDSRLDVMADEADVSEVIDETERPEASDETDEEDVDLRMKAGRGGAR